MTPHPAASAPSPTVEEGMREAVPESVHGAQEVLAEFAKLPASGQALVQRLAEIVWPVMDRALAAEAEIATLRSAAERTEAEAKVARVANLCRQFCGGRPEVSTLVDIMAAVGISPETDRADPVVYHVEVWEPDSYRTLYGRLWPWPQIRLVRGMDRGSSYQAESPEALWKLCQWAFARGFEVRVNKLHKEDKSR